MFELIDLPGTYGLGGGSEDEQIAVEYIESGCPDKIVVVCDAVSLERSLILALEIRKRTDKMILCVNLIDEAEKLGITIDRNRLSEQFGVPVVLTAAGRRKGLEQLVKVLEKPLVTIPAEFDEDSVLLAQRIASECVLKADTSSNLRKLKLDQLFAGRLSGSLIFLGLLFLIIWLTVWGANVPSQALEWLFERSYLWLDTHLIGIHPWLKGILLDGAYATAGRVICVMLPPMAIFFPLFTLLEDVGYLPRLAFLLDGPMQKCGGCGKQALTMCMGFGCNAVGVTGCRIIDSPKERLLAILTNAMIPCNGRFPTLILLACILFEEGAALIVACSIILAVLTVMATSGVLSRTVLKQEQTDFVMEIPPFRRPRIMQVLVRSLFDRTLKIAGRALIVAAPSGAVIWILARTGLLQSFASFLDPFAIHLGMSGAILLAFILSLPANELLFSVILLTISGTISIQASGAMDTSIILSQWSTETLLCTLVFTLFHWPCATTILTIYRETKSLKKTAAAFFLPTAVGMTMCLMLHLLFKDFCG